MDTQGLIQVGGQPLCKYYKNEKNIEFKKSVKNSETCFNDKEEAKKAIFEHIEVFCKRILVYLSRLICFSYGF